MFSFMAAHPRSHEHTERKCNVMKHAGRKLGILCLSLIGTLLLSSCTYTLQEAPQSPSSTPEQGDEEEAAEPEAHEILRDQLIALYNLNHAAQKQLTVNRNLDESASLLIDIVLKDPFLHYAPENKFAFTSLLGDPCNELSKNSVYLRAFLYDGADSSAQVAAKALNALNGSLLADSLGDSQQLASLSVAWGSSAEDSFWLLLIQSEDIP